MIRCLVVIRRLVIIRLLGIIRCLVIMRHLVMIRRRCLSVVVLLPAQPSLTHSVGAPAAPDESSAEADARAAKEEPWMGFGCGILGGMCRVSYRILE